MDATEISALSDDELYAKLQEVGAAIGPIVPTTRTLYERQLLRILHGISLHELSQESGDEPEKNVQFDDSKSTDNFSPTSTSSPQTVFGSAVEVRHRPFKTYSEAHDGIYFDRTSLARSSYRSDLKSTPSEVKFHFSSKPSSTPSSQQRKKVPVAVWFVLACIVILAVLMYFNMESSNKNMLPNLS